MLWRRQGYDMWSGLVVENMGWHQRRWPGPERVGSDPGESPGQGAEHCQWYLDRCIAPQRNIDGQWNRHADWKPREHKSDGRWSSEIMVFFCDGCIFQCSFHQRTMVERVESLLVCKEFTVLSTIATPLSLVEPIQLDRTRTPRASHP